jgi:hypothetical protein
MTCKSCNGRGYVSVMCCKCLGTATDQKGEDCDMCCGIGIDVESCPECPGEAEWDPEEGM